MDNLNQNLNTVVSLALGSVLTFLTTWFWVGRAAAVKARDQALAENLAIQNRLVEMEIKLQLLQQSVVPISSAFQAILIKELTHPHTLEMDMLLTKVGPPSTLSEAQDARLMALLIERANDFSFPDSERDAARILPAIMRRVQAEYDTINKGKTLDLTMVLMATAQPTPRGLLIKGPEDHEDRILDQP